MLTREALISYAARYILPPLFRAARSSRLAQFGSVLLEAGNQVKSPVTVVQGETSAVAMPGVLTKIIEEDLAFVSGISSQAGENSKHISATENASLFQRPRGCFDGSLETLQSLYTELLLQRSDMQAAEEFLRINDVAVEDQHDIGKQPERRGGSDARRRALTGEIHGNPFSLAGAPTAFGDVKKRETENSFESETPATNSLDTLVLGGGAGKVAGNLLGHLSSLGAFCRVHSLAKEPDCTSSTDFASWLQESQAGATVEFLNALDRWAACC